MWVGLRRAWVTYVIARKNEKYAIIIQGIERLLYIELRLLRSNHNLRCQYSLPFVVLLALFLLDYSNDGLTLLA